MLFDRPGGRLSSGRAVGLPATGEVRTAERLPPPAGCAVAAHGLDTAWGRPDRPLDDRRWSTLMTDAPRHRIVGLLASAVREGALPTTVDQRRTLARVVDRWVSGALMLERMALHTHRVLDGAAIEHRFLKGLALAHLDYAAPDQRLFGDVDVAVRSADVPAAVEVLTAAVGPRVEPELRPGFDREFGKGATFATAEGDQVDLHRTLVWGALGLTVDEEQLFEAGRELTVGDVVLPALDGSMAFLHACYSAVVGDVPPRLVSLRDVVQTLPDGADADRAIEVARRWRAGAVVALALRRARAVLQLRSPHRLFAWADAYRPPRSEMLLLRSHLMPGGTYARRVAAVAVIGGLGARVRYVRASLWPSREYLSARGFTVARHLRRSVRFVGIGRPG